jgi:hypothetical protein
VETLAIRIDDLRELLINFLRIFDQDLLRTGLISKPVLGMNFKTKTQIQSFSVNFPWFHNSKSRRKNCPISTVSKAHNHSRFFKEQTQSNPCSLHKKTFRLSCFHNAKLVPISDFLVHNCYQLKTDFLWKRVIKFYPKPFSFQFPLGFSTAKVIQKTLRSLLFPKHKIVRFPLFQRANTIVALFAAQKSVSTFLFSQRKIGFDFPGFIAHNCYHCEKQGILFFLWCGNKGKSNDLLCFENKGTKNDFFAL